MLPYWIALDSHGVGRGENLPFLSSFLRIFRFFRILRVVKLVRSIPQAHEMLDLVKATVVKSLAALLVLMMFLLLQMIFFGSLIYFLEGGTFQVRPYLDIDHAFV